MDGSQATTIEAANARLLADGELDAVDEYFTPEYVVRTADGAPIHGPRAVRGFVKQLREAFPDLEVEVEILVESGDRVAWQRTLRGTQSGAFMGFPATGRRVVWRDMLTSRFQGGRIAEEGAVSDLAERLLHARKA